ncbi:efflux RND transporter periplasmic adaptor subunit [Estrella lausannensis]|uniref:Efflux transporter, RND family n=1 Tax=Estrella lausannensis TaxID=483423 RepID=A0A0H5DQ11_9BACT|nr:efflux RND transporter periplasmic adaptor subunit [Estrella lausannensis]CRX38711.1 Efflux transporter, RND family [Estrella lausannensis]
MVFFQRWALNIFALLCLSSLTAAAEEQINESADEAGKRGSRYLVVLEPKMKTLISAEVMSPVTAVNKKMGDRVQKGELILKLDDTIYYANFLKTEANLSKATVEMDITRRLFEDKSASLFDLKSAEAQLAQANSEYWQAKKLYESTFVRAPYNGKVVKVYLDEYELSQPGKELVEIVDDSKLYARFLVPSAALSTLKNGSALVMKIDGLPKDIEANITRISPIIEAVSGTVKIEAEIDNAHDLLIAGMVGQAGISGLSRLQEDEHSETTSTPEHPAALIESSQNGLSEKRMAL